jgi:hypothetical protein
MPDFHVIKLLFIDENKENQRAFMKLVKDKKLPYNYTIVTSISEAIDTIREEKFDIVVTNAILKNGTASELLPFVASTPIIYITKDIEDLPIVIEKIVTPERSPIVSNEMLQKFKKITNQIGLQEAIHGTIFHLTRLGPELTFTTKEKSSVFTFNDYLRIGNFFYIAVGQGNERNIGLYELPVPGYPDFHSFVYAFEVLDPDNDDPRAQGKNYCMLAILFPKWIREFLGHFSSLNQILAENLIQFQTLTDLKIGTIFDQIFPAILNLS